MKYRTLKSLLLLLAIIAIAGCSKDEEPIILNPVAGTNLLDVENEGYVVELNAVPAPKGQQGTWRVYIGENGRFENVNDPKTNFYGEPGEKYVLAWELSERGEYKSASIDVSFKPLNPIITSIPQDTLHNNISFYLEAEAPRFGAKGQWSIVSGDGAEIVGEENNESVFIGDKFNEYTLRWTLSYGSKEAFKEIQFVTDELKAFAGEDNLDIVASKTAKTKFFTLEGFLPAGATGNWNIIKGQQGTVHSEAIDNSLFEGLADTAYTLTWTVDLAGLQSVDTVDLRFRGKWGMWIDERDGQSYRFTVVNGLEWMADNYNYAEEPGYGSWYYGHDERSIVEDGHPLENEDERKYYGRLYDWHNAMDNAPEGWRLPSGMEFNNMVVALGGDLYADPKIKEGGDTGIDLNYAGYYNLAIPSDPSFRNSFVGQDKSGLYWLSDYTEIYDYASVFEVTSSSATPGSGYLPTKFFKLSVRYVREIQE
ncbi:FISUMP domain-containing protein [Labilibacter marinus]|uniref:FISUMP domain-containing protein n=1 Tax=Labilibacter marinus TaxID=1477105 RepID=UPI00094FEDDA|nr:FISUMP domain-containing protein [Labilibacter marinus]